MGIGLADKWYETKIEKILSKVVKKYGTSLKPEEQDNIINKAVKIYSFIITISLALFLIYFFTTITYKSIGFERTTLVLLTIIMLRMKWK